LPNALSSEVVDVLAVWDDVATGPSAVDALGTGSSGDAAAFEVSGGSSAALDDSGGSSAAEDVFGRRDDELEEPESTGSSGELFGPPPEVVATDIMMGRVVATVPAVACTRTGVTAASTKTGPADVAIIRPPMVAMPDAVGRRMVRRGDRRPRHPSGSRPGRH